MRTVDDFARIRQLHRDGLSTRQIARQLGCGRDTIRKALANPEPKLYSLVEPREAPLVGTISKVSLGASKRFFRRFDNEPFAARFAQ